MVKRMIRRIWLFYRVVGIYHFFTMTYLENSLRFLRSFPHGIVHITTFQPKVIGHHFNELCRRHSPNNIAVFILEIVYLIIASNRNRILAVTLFLKDVPKEYRPPFKVNLTVSPSSKLSIGSLGTLNVILLGTQSTALVICTPSSRFYEPQITSALFRWSAP